MAQVLLRPPPTPSATEPNGTGTAPPFAGPATPAADRRPGHVPTGSSRLDALLGGGFPPGTAMLLYGPPFVGKQALQQAAFAAAAARGLPCTYILHSVGADAMSRRLRAIDPRVADAEAAGRVLYVDAHSPFLGEPAGHPNAVALESPPDGGALAQALQQRGATQGLLAIQSASTLLLDLGPAKAFQFLRSVLGRTAKAGGVALASLHAGMHPDAEVHMAKHLCAGMLEMRPKGDSHGLRVEGLETTVARPGWIEYEAGPRSFRLTGSFAARTIR